MNQTIYSRVLDAWGRVCGRPSLRRLNNLLVNLGARGLGVGDADSTRNGELRNLRHLLSAERLRDDRPVIFDVGANEGSFTEMVLECSPGAVVHAFEPHPETFLRLRNRHAGRSVQCHNIGLGGRTETRDLWDYAANAKGSSHATFYPGAVRETRRAELTPRRVSVCTIDDVASAESIESITLLKLDVEGHELACLEGAAGLLSRGAIETVQFEFNLMHLDARVNMNDFAERLSGFDLFRVLAHGLVPLERGNPMLRNLYYVQNIFAVRRSSMPIAQDTTSD